jgi:hypothetical protein
MREALAAGERAFGTRTVFGISSQDVKQGFLHALEAALGLGDREKVDELCSLVEAVPVGLRPPYLAATARCFRAKLAGDDPSAGAGYTAATEALRALVLPFHLAVVLLERGEWLADRGLADDAEPLVAEARVTFERLRATPWVERAARLSTAARAPEPVAAGD